MRKIFTIILALILIVITGLKTGDADKLQFIPFYEAVESSPLYWEMVSLGNPMEVELRIRNDGNEHLSLLIPLGMKIASQDSAYTDLIVAKGEGISIGPHYHRTVKLYTFGLDPGKKSPESGKKMKVTFFPPPGGKIYDLLKLAGEKRPNETRVPDFMDYPAQAAIWRLTNLMDIHKMVDSFAHFISPKELKFSARKIWRQSNKLLEDIGMDVEEINSMTIRPNSTGFTPWDFLDLTRKK
ncbi:MAG: hypothetical protein J7M18_06495 [Candidatus Eremiobacteraeota bacterium]|nr:hypothetical protein [Candidatus Eremiobacteraeota bacterium]